MDFFVKHKPFFTYKINYLKQIALLLFLLSTILTCFAQQKNIKGITNIEGDTALAYPPHVRNIKKAGLENLLKSKDSLHLRLSTDIQAIDIWTQDNKTFYGSLSNFTSTYISIKKRKNKKPTFYSKTITLDTATARKIYMLFKNHSILKIPAQDSITNWKSGLDGNLYILESSTPNNYSFECYWSPCHYNDSIDEARDLCEFKNVISEFLNLWKSFNHFLRSLPSGSYRAGGIKIISIQR